MADDNVISFVLRPTPKHATDSEISKYWEFASDLMRSQAAALNAETAFIDLQRKYKIKVERHGLYRLPEFHAIDELTFDADPESRWHIVGVGYTEPDAKLDLLDKLSRVTP